jgi:hypothetical protein
VALDFYYNFILELDLFNSKLNLFLRAAAMKEVIIKKPS